MLFYIYYDELSYIYEPHGTQVEVWSTTLEGTQMLKASGWKPFEMQRVSRSLHLDLLSGGLLCEGVPIAPNLRRPAPPQASVSNHVPIG